MKTCPVCALDLEDSYLYCPDDGSNLTSLSRGLSNRKIASDASPVNEAGVVLYCPMCAAEYPLTFSSCPVHGVPLTKHSIPKPSSSEAKLREPSSASQATASAPRFRQDEPKPAKPLTVPELKRPQIQDPPQAPASLQDGLDEDSAPRFRKDEPRSAKPRTVLELKRPQIEGPPQAHANLRDSLDEDSAPRFRSDEPRSAKPRTVLELKRPQIEGPPRAHASLRDSLEDSGTRFRKDEPRPAKKRLTLLELKRSQIKDPPQDPASVRDGSARDLRLNPAFCDADAFDDNRYTDSPIHEPRFNRPGFRAAAIATVLLLAIFGLAAIYTLFSGFSRRSASQTKKAASEMQDTSKPLPFVATPTEAQEYKEEPPAVSPTAEQPPEPASEPERRDEPERRERIPTAPVGPGARVSPNTYPMPKTQTAVAPAPAVAPPRISPPMPALPRGDSGGFDARLVRVRSRMTPAGVRYDLTFNMLERAGRAAHWQRVLISTRSASGASHSEAIPFSHRLGASGAITFTISVELTGRSDADWQGRIVCTTLGWDNNGAPLQASFGANVTP